MKLPCSCYEYLVITISNFQPELLLVYSLLNIIAVFFCLFIVFCCCCCCCSYIFVLFSIGFLPWSLSLVLISVPLSFLRHSCCILLLVLPETSFRYENRISRRQLTEAMSVFTAGTPTKFQPANGRRFSARLPFAG